MSVLCKENVSGTVKLILAKCVLLMGEPCCVLEPLPSFCVTSGQSGLYCHNFIVETDLCLLGLLVCLIISNLSVTMAFLF